MEIFTLNSSHKPGDTIKDFESLAWVERYQSSGDFQLVVEDDVTVLETLPTGTLISHTDTREVMIVENHEVGRDKKRKLKVTISGRSFETFAENRITLGSQQALYTAGNVALVETDGPSPPSGVAAYLLSVGLEPGTATADNAIANLSVYSDMRVADSNLSHIIKRGDIYSRVIELLKLIDGGIKILRPLSGSTMDMIVHDGNDLTDLVVFYAQYEDLDDAKYFWSIKGYKNYIFVAGKYSGRQIRSRDVPVDQTGLDRRVMYLAAEDLEGNYVPGTATDVLVARGQAALDENKKVALLQATISATAKPKFKIHYDVGDLVTVFGEFGVAQTMRVTEHILAIDDKGMRGYPSLNIV